MVKISLAMVVKNEAANLANCLTSVQDLVTEMVILDTGSEDETKVIATSRGARVYDFAWVNDFSAARNYLMQYVTGDWVLVLDGDEVLNPLIVPQLKLLMEQPENLVINLLRQEVGALQSPYSLVSRLFRRHPQIKFTRPYHSLIDDSVLSILETEPHWQIKELSEVSIYHYGYQPEAIRSLAKSQRARSSMEQFWQQNPQDPYVCSKLGALYLQQGEPEKGLKLLKTALNRQPKEPILLFELHYQLANAYSNNRQWDKAVENYQKAIAQPILPKLKLGAYHNLGSLLQSKGDFNQGRQLAQLTVEIDPCFALGYYNLGLALKSLGDYPGAVKAYQKSIELNPDYAYSYQNLGVVWFKLGNLTDSLPAFRKALELHHRYNPEAEAKLRQGLFSLGIQEI